MSNTEQRDAVSLELDGPPGGTTPKFAPKPGAQRVNYAQLSSGVLIGGGMGGFFDGILFHQILQWHNMLSAIHPPTDLVAMKYNMLWDGAFHAFVWLLTAFGIFRLWSVSRRGDVARGATLLGGVFVGWGAFNVVEGFVNHYVLGLHHVRPSSSQALWDAAFLFSGVVMAIAGLVLVRRGNSTCQSSPDVRVR